MKTDVAAYEYLWTDERENVVLVQLKAGRSVEESLIYDQGRQTALVIEDEEVHREVIRHLIDAGVKIVQKMP